jgi:hypothetical protein
MMVATGVQYVALLLQHTQTTFSKMEYLEIFLNAKMFLRKYLNCKGVSHEVSKLQRCFSQNIREQKNSYLNRKFIGLLCAHE